MEKSTKEHKSKKESTKKSKRVVDHVKKGSSSAWLWPVVCIILVALLVASIITSGFSFTGAKSGTTLSKAQIEAKTTDYITKLTAAQGAPQTVTVKVINESSGLYFVSIDMAGSKIPAYVSKDGRLLFPPVSTAGAGIDMDQKIPTASETQAQKAQDIPKADKPTVEAFVMAYCPYGTQIEKGMIPVIKLLKDKADIQIKFVNYAMHGQKEVVEELNQVCIKKVYPDKYVSYLECFLNASDSTGCMAKEGITDASLATCKDETDKQYKIMEDYNDPAKTNWMGSYPPFNVYETENQAYGIQGSPTLVINGVQADTARDAASLLAAICDSFTDAPAECNTDMTSYGNPAAGFGWTNQGAAASTGGGCGG
jgi:protein-disulfide isomerase